MTTATLDKVSLATLPMRIAVGQLKELTEEHLAFAVQVGAEDVQLNTPDLPGEERWEYEDLKALREKANAAGLRLIALENVPVRFYDQIMLNGPERDRQMENMIATVRNMGKAGIPILGYHWMPNGVWRTSFETKVRGGAISNEFRYREVENAPNTHDRLYTPEEMWVKEQGYMELGYDPNIDSCARCLDEGGLIWSGGSRTETVEEWLHAMETGLEHAMAERGL